MKNHFKSVKCFNNFDIIVLIKNLLKIYIL